MPQPISRRRFLKNGSFAALGLAAWHPGRILLQPRFDWVIKDAWILDGTGGPEWKADLGVSGDSIAAIGSIDPAQGKRVIGANGLWVAPGFIDIHTHSDGGILAYPTADSRVLQGITTEVTGNCGHSAAPLRGVDLQERRKAFVEEGIAATWTDVASYFNLLEETGISVNHALLLGQGTLRRNAVGMVDRPLSAEERAQVLAAVEEGMDQGAIGLSTGLEYTPGRYTPTDEIVAMARVVARRGGLYASHIRNEEATLLEAINEAIDIGRRAGVRVQISHLKAAGRPNWNKQAAAIDLIESARREGVDLLADAYPYTAYSTGLTLFLEPWALEGGARAIVARLRDPELRARIRKEVPARVRRDPGDYELVVISRVRSEKNRRVVGMDLVEIAERWKSEPVEVILRLLEEEEASVSFVGHGMSEENVAMVLANPLVMIGSDGVSMAPVGKAAESRPHPRSYGTYPRVLGRYVRDRRLLDLPTAIRKMTSMPADQSGFSDRGRIARGLKADLVVFDAANVEDRATFENPHQFPQGIRHVFVNGVQVVEDGRHTGARPGRILRRE